MWTWSLNWGEITDHIMIGTCPMISGDIDRIYSETGVSGIFSLQHDECLDYWDIDEASLLRAGKRMGIVMERCPIRDFDVSDMRRRLPEAVSMLAKMLGQANRVYVHCTAGIGRAPLTVLGYLTLVDTYSPEEAIQLIQRARPEAMPSWEAYYGCWEDLNARYRQAIEKRAHEIYKAGEHKKPSADWRQAEAEVLRSVLTPKRSV